MNRFNLEFSGEILSGDKLEQVKLRFGKLFAIDDPERIDRFFSGERVVLRRNLERKEAAQWFQDMRKLGAVAELVKITAEEAAAAVTGIPSSRSKDSAPSSTADDTAKKQASKRKAQEDAATERKTQLVHKKQLAAQEAEQRKAEKARKKAEQAEVRRKAEQQKQKERKRKKAEELARKQEAERKRKEAEELARKQEAERKRKEAEELARKQEAERKRKEAEELARKQEAERKRKEAERERLEAEQERKDAERQRKQAERERKDAERQRKKAKRDRKIAEREEARQIAAEKAARNKAQKEQARAELAGKKAEEATRRAAKIEEKSRQTEEVGRHKEEQERKKALRTEATAAERTAMEEKTIQRAASELARKTALKPARARAKTSLEVPQRKSGKTEQATPASPGRRQRGEPNLYQLNPFRNTPEVQGRCELADRKMRQGFTVGVIALLAVVALATGILRNTPQPPVTSASAIAIDSLGGPLLVAGQSLLLHDRAGVEKKRLPLSELGLTTLRAPLVFETTGALLAMGRPGTDTASEPSSAPFAEQLLRCDLSAQSCAAFSSELAGHSIDAFALHPLTGNLLLADSKAGALHKVDRQGKLLASAEIALPGDPVLRLHSGLLLMNSGQGPAISVYRYDDNAFAQQLDEVLLLPDPAVEAQQSVVSDFLWSGGSWWVVLINPDTGSAGVYRFDEQWNYLGQVELTVASAPLQLTGWADKTLVNDLRQPAIARFNSDGAAEVPLQSALLTELITQRQQRARYTRRLTGSALLLSGLLALAGLGFGYLQALRRLVYKPHRERGAEPVDDHVNALYWINRAQNRRTLLRRRGFSYGALVLAAVLVAIVLGISAVELGALLIALSGPAIALLLLARQPPGHIGILDERLLLVDHSGMYHLGGGARLQYRGPFLFIDDVAVFTGNRLLPAFFTSQVNTVVKPLAFGGVRVDRTTVTVKLLQSRHPLALGALAILAAATAAVFLLCLQGIV